MSSHLTTKSEATSWIVGDVGINDNLQMKVIKSKDSDRIFVELPAAAMALERDHAIALANAILEAAKCDQGVSDDS